jgi:glycine cleavage system H protein
MAEEYRIEEGYYYTKEHQWAKVEGNRAVVGVTDYGQHQLGDVVFVELPEIGKEVEAGDPVANLESVKAVTEVYSPLTGKVVGVNDELNNDPSLINVDPYGDGWIYEMEMSDPSEVEDLMTADDYRAYLEELEKEEEEV